MAEIDELEGQIEDLEATIKQLQDEVKSWEEEAHRLHMALDDIGYAVKDAIK